MRAVLFDFDGTLADTAPDLAGALNRMLADRGRPSLPLEAVRPHASSGARGLLYIGFGVVPDDASYPALREEFLANYSAAICVHTRLFPGIAELLASLESRKMVWGIVTNKAVRLTTPLVAHLGLAGRAGCVVGGDTTPHLKPHPASLLHAADSIRIKPSECCYLGDDLRDIQAAKAAGMFSIAVEYGYSGTENGGPRGWNAEAVIGEPLDLLRHL
jgi:2-phosphoglycolate phosphatase